MTYLWRWVGRFFLYLVLTLIFIMLLNITLQAVLGVSLGQMGGVVATLVPAFLTGMQFAKAEKRVMTRSEMIKFAAFVVAIQLLMGLFITLASGLVPMDTLAPGALLLVMVVLFVVYTGVAVLFLFLGGRDGIKR
ncbi:ABZJ_00895 family protein [Nereida sp. MMG025]|uniref:ABZJ_00895 family protein n=1 Tax=Nereida sp. MMG025 TaxID=2909981 RepID=UPI001F29523A|nr:ABZJ_00895 family protein [Nereida sp. MMG025]MCF6443163.1 ABZJ_00895 family protein [Nereida sp. MMG025]